MNQIENAILNYLNMQVQYSLLITGDWGIGKTYFIREEMFPKIKEKYITPILVSLAGVNDVDEIYKRIYVNLYPQLDSELSSVGKIFLRSVISFTRLGNLDEHIKDFNQILKKKILKGLLICFDDLERKGEVSWEELIGLVLSLLESETVKVIFIGSEKAINEDGYPNFKEKVIGLTLEFNKKLESIAPKIIETRYKSSDYDQFRQFLDKEEIKKIIFEKFKKREHQNLRSIIFFLEVFSKIFYALLKFRNRNNLDDIKAEVEELLLFSLAVSIEFKLGNLSSDDRKRIDQPAILEDMFSASMEAETVDNINYRQEFIALYYPKEIKYFFSEAIYNFITAGHLNIEKLNEEIKEWFKENPPSHESIYNTLRMGGYRLTNTEFEENVRELINHVKNGNYRLVEYPSMFSYLREFAKILKLDKEKLKRGVRLGMKQAAQKHSYEPHLDEMLQSPYLKNDNELTKLSDFAKKLNNAKLLKDEHDRRTELESLLKNSFDVFMKKIEEDYPSESVLNKISAYKFYKTIIHLENNQIDGLNTFFIRRFYSNNYNIQFLTEEKDFLENLNEHLNRKPKWRNKNNLKNYNIQRLSSTVKKSLEEIGRI